MTCPECGSEVAKNDVFCPFCGISLQPVAAGEPEPEDSFESTIMMQPGEAADMARSLETSKSEESADSPDEDTIAQKDEEPGDAVVEEKAGEIESKTPIESSPADALLSVEAGGEIDSIDDIPAPAILQDISTKTSDNVAVSSTSEFSVEDEPFEDNSETEQESDASREPVVESVEVESEPQTEAESQTYTEESAATIAEPEEIEESQPEVEDVPEEPTSKPPEFIMSVDVIGSSEEVEADVSTASPADEVNADAPVQETVTATETVENEEAAATENIEDVPERASTEEASLPEENREFNPVEETVPVDESIEEKVVPPSFETPRNEDVYQERVALSQDRISRPEEVLESDDGYLRPSKFDSVRIIENKTPSIPPGMTAETSSADKATGPQDIPQIEPTGPEIDVKPPSGAETGLNDTDGRKGSKLKPLTEGTVLNGRYEIVRKIGGGGMGAVYLASDNNLGGVLRAVKEMVQAHIEEEQQDKAIEDFKRESMILSTLDHSAIPTIYDYFYDDKECRFYLVMKYISGGDLSSRLRSAPEGRIDEKSITEWAIQIIDVLDYLHNQPSTIVYRDLKPSNIMIDGNSGRLMLIDFGIARSIGQKQEKGVTAVGTMGYAPPELFSGNVEPRSDIYSLGSTMFHLLTGADPQSNPLLIFDFQKNPRPRQINPQLSDQIERILMRAVEYNADARFESAAEMRSVLEAHLANLNSGNLTYGVTEAPISVSLANQSVFCGFCGQRIVATDLFCAFCGAKQPLAQQGVHSEIYQQASMTAKLVVEGTSDLDAPAYSLQKDENLLGRRDPMSNIFPEVDLSKYDPQTKISRRHARIWRDGNNFMVEDLGSSNGTILASAIKDAFRLQPHQPHLLSSGDKIKVGDATLHFVVG